MAPDREITSLDSARKAFAKLNWEEKVTNALQLVGVANVIQGRGALTVGRVYNASGDAIHRLIHKDWEGNHLLSPKTIANKKWDTFLRAPSCGSDSGAFVYKCKTPWGCEKEWMFSWTIDKTWGNKRAYTEIQTADYAWDWEKVRKTTDEAKAESTYKANGLTAYVWIDEEGYYNAALY